MKDRRILFWVLFLATLVLDQVVKGYVRGHFHVHESSSWPWPGVFEITLIYNEGIAFGMLKGFAILATPIAVGMAGFAIYYSQKHSQESRWTHTIAALVASGALGNLYDRVVRGQVTDMFWFRAINFPVFNVADACITIAGFMLAIAWLKDMPAGERKAPEKDLETA